MMYHAMDRVERTLCRHLVGRSHKDGTTGEGFQLRNLFSRKRHAPVAVRPVLYPVAEVVTTYNTLLTCAQAWVTIVPPDDSSFVYLRRWVRIERGSKTACEHTVTVTVSEISLLVNTLVLPMALPRETKCSERLTYGSLKH